MRLQSGKILKSWRITLLEELLERVYDTVGSGQAIFVSDLEKIVQDLKDSKP